MTVQFFPRDRQFWMYHCSALAVGVVVEVALTLLPGFMPGYQIGSTIAWVPLYTLAGLGFRWLYQRHGGETAAMARLIAMAVVYSAIAGLVIAALVQSTVLPLYWAGFYKKFSSVGMPLDYGEFLFRRIYEEAPQNQMFVLVWCFIYISVTGNRRVQKAELFNLRLQNNLKEAQLSSLSNQLNPHFLFNSLNNIRFMIHEDAQRADSMLTSLSDILRYSLESSRHEKISLGQELAIIARYIAVVGVQFEQRLRFTMRIAPDLHVALVPPMVLQMLVENAIKHGLDHLAAGGDLSLDAGRDGERLIFSIENDAPVPASGQPGMGLGLRNIAQRLALLYGERASIDVAALEGRFRVELVLPFERAS